MDFVVAGFGFGALMVVIGFVVRDVGPFVWRRTGVDSSPDEREAAGRWRGLCHAVSTALTAGGVVIIVVTVAAVAIGLSDSAGSLAVLIASIVGVALAVALSARTAQEYRRGSIRALPVRPVPQRAPRPARHGLSSQTTGPLPAVARPAPKPVAPVEPEPAAVEAEPETAPPVVAEPEPLPDEPFDVNKLLPEELHHDDGAELPPFGRPPRREGPSEPVVEDALIAERPSLSTERKPTSEVVAVDAPTPISEEQTPEAPEEQPAPVAEQTAAVDDSGPEVAGVEPEPARPTQSGTTAFESPLLAGISAEAEAKPFSSRLLADVDPGDADDVVTYQSPLLADLVPVRSGEATPSDDDDGDDAASRREP